MVGFLKNLIFIERFLNNCEEKYFGKQSGLSLSILLNHRRCSELYMEVYRYYGVLFYESM